MKSVKEFFYLNILDRYLLKKYLSTIFFFVFIFILIAVSIDYSEKTDNFANPQMTRKEAILYFVAFIPYIITLLLPIFSFVSTIFFTSKMAARTEFIPMFASGISLTRILKPYLLGSCLIFLLAWSINISLLPSLNQTRTTFLEKYVDGSKYDLIVDNISVKIDSNKILEIQFYDPVSKYGNKVGLYETEAMKGVKRIIRADSILWDSLTKTWTLKNMIVRTFYDKHEKVERQQSLKLNTFITPKDFRYNAYLKERLTTKELKSKIRQEEVKGSSQINFYKIELYKRVATPFSIVVLSVIAAIISSRKIRGGSGIHLAIGLLISAISVGLDRMSTVFSTNANLNPFIAAWLPNIIFSVVAIVLLRKSQQ